MSVGLGGIQKFLTRAVPPLDMPAAESGEKGVARRLRARSFYVSLLSWLVGRRLLEAVGMPPVNLMIDAGGRSILLLPETEAVLARLNRGMDYIRDWFSRHLGGILRLDLAVSPRLEDDAFTQEMFPQTFREADRLLAGARLQVPVATLRSERGWSDSGWVGDELSLPVDRDRFDWKQAQAILRNIPQEEAVLECGWDVDALQRQADHVQTCKKEWNSPQRLIDLLANADRCIAAGRYDDAVARLYRLTEYIGQVRFAARFDIDQPNSTSNVPVQTLMEHVPNVAESVSRRATQNSKDSAVNLGLYDTIQALAEAGDPVGHKMNELCTPPDPARPHKKGPLGAQLDARNESLLAHGARPVSEDNARELRQTVATILEEHVTVEGRTLDELLAPAQFLRCPWVTE